MPRRENESRLAEARAKASASNCKPLCQRLNTVRSISEEKISHGQLYTHGIFLCRAAKGNSSCCRKETATEAPVPANVENTSYVVEEEKLQGTDGFVSYALDVSTA